MNKNKNSTVDMITCSAETSRKLFNMGIKKDNKELVVAVGYAKSGQFGYFICWEENTGREFIYTDQLLFKKKENEKTYQQVLAEAKRIASTL